MGASGLRFVGRVAGLLLAAAVLTPTILSAQAPTPPDADAHVQAPPHAIPLRPARALGGQAFIRRIAGLPRRDREAAIFEEVAAGNVPGFLRQLCPVTLTYQPARGGEIRATVWVTPDYLAVGSDDDFVRVPVDFYTAVAVAARFGMSLPTRKIVDAVHSQSSFRLRPQPQPPGPQMTSAAYFVRHNRAIEEQRRGRQLGDLVSGHKKDLVLTNRLLLRPARVAIYGWHRRDGSAIQPLSTVHGARYADYSHGLRLVAGVVELNGERRSFFDVLADPELARVLSYEGVVRVPAGLRRPGSDAAVSAPR